MFARVDKFDDFFRETFSLVVETNHRENWAKNFFLHHSAFGRNFVEQSRFDKAACSLTSATIQEFSVLQIAAHALVSLLVDHAHIMRRSGDIISMQVLDTLRKSLYKCLFYRSVNQEIIGRDTSLTAIERFSPGDTFGRQFHIGIFIDDAGTFST